MTEKSDWNEWSNHVLQELNRLYENLKELNKTQNTDNTEALERMQEIKLHIVKEINDVTILIDKKISDYHQKAVSPIKEDIDSIKLTAARISGIIAAITAIVNIAIVLFSK